MSTNQTRVELNEYRVGAYEIVTETELVDGELKVSSVDVTQRRPAFMSLSDAIDSNIFSIESITQEELDFLPSDV